MIYLPALREASASQARRLAARRPKNNCREYARSLTLPEQSLKANVRLIAGNDGNDHTPATAGLSSKIDRFVPILSIQMSSQ